LFNKKGDLIGTDFTYADPYTLKPWQKSPFNIYIEEDTGDKVKAFEDSHLLLLYQKYKKSRLNNQQQKFIWI